MMRRCILPLLLLFAFATPSLLKSQMNVELVNSGQVLFEGQLYYYMGRYSKAESVYEKVGRNDTNYAEVTRNLALAYSEDKEDSLCMVTCYKGLALKSEYEPDFYSLLGSSLKELNHYDTALKTLDEGIRLYPNSFILRYQKGMAYFKMKKYPEAQKSFQEAVGLNPFHASSHFMLGKTCAEQGRRVPAILSYEFFLMFESEGERAQKVVSALEDLYSGEYQPDPDLKLEASEAGDNCFGDIEDMIDSKVALQPGYKNKTKINLKLVKQWQAMFEKLHYEANTGNWWMETYVPFYTAVQREGYFVPYVSYALLPVAGNPTVGKSIKKNKKKIIEFAKWTNKFIKEHLKHPVAEMLSDKTNVDYVFYDNHMVAGVGHSDAKGVNTGEWFFFYAKGGHLMSHGYFDAKGLRTGDWVRYFNNGDVREKSHYENGLREGPSEEYYMGNVLGFKCTYSKGEVEGDYEVYGIHGGMTEKATMHMGKLDGMATAYYNNGAKQAEFSYKMGKLDGESRFYTFDGKMYRKANYTLGKMNGHSTDYYASGQIKNDGEYKNDALFGYWKVYWDNGKVQREGLYKDKGLREGEWKEYYRDGTPKATAVFKAGKYNGVINEYDIDGKIYIKSVYATDKLKSKAYYDKSGKEIASYNIGKGTTTVTEYHPNGEKAAEGDYYNGERDGVWKYYSSNGGWLTQKEHFEHGSLVGDRLEYYPNGKEKSEVNYNNDERDGYLKVYYPNGNLQTEGWFVRDERQGDWYTYNERGTIVSHRYFLNDEPHGYQEFFDQKGRKEEEVYYKAGCVWTRTSYDSTGTVTYKYQSEHGNGTFAGKLPNDQVWLSQQYKNGDLEGPTVRYDYHGVKLVETEFVNGQQHGSRKEAYPVNGKPFLETTFAYDEQTGASTAWWENGNKRWEENYLYDEKDGVQKYYHENGQLKKETHYDYGTLTGDVTYWSEDGQLIIVFTYRDGNLVGYSYKGKDGAMVQMIEFHHSSGKFTAYYENGEKSMEGEYDNGRLIGHCVEYFPNGKVSEDENYDYGDYEGVQKYYNYDGSLKREENYYADEADGTWKYYYPNGQLEHTEYYILGDNFGTWQYFTEDGKEKMNQTWYADHQLAETIAHLPPPTPPSTKPKPKTK